MSAVTGERQFERVARVEGGHWWFVGLREVIRDWVVRRVGPRGRVLDAGCGTGRMLADLPEYERVGFDFNPEPLEVARRTEPGVQFLEASINEIPLGDEEFDGAVSLDVLCVKGVDELAALRELRRVLRPGGTLVMNLPAYEWLRSGHDVIANTARRYTRRQLVLLVREAGFEPVRVSYRVTAVFPLAAVRRLLTRGRVGTDVGEVNPLVNRVLTALVRAENRLIRSLPLPFGLSVLVVAEKPADARR